MIYNSLIDKSKMGITSKFYSDSEEFEYNKVVKEERFKLQKYGWDKEEVTYTLNSNGFRERAMDADITNGGIICIGCSNTFGQGVNNKDSWPRVVESKLGINVWNLGVPGISGNIIFKLLYHWIPILKPSAVFILETFSVRLDVIFDEGMLIQEVYMPYFIDDIKKRSPNDYYLKWVSNDYNIYYNALRNEYSIKQLCSSHNIPSIIMPVHKINQIRSELGDNKRIYARDLLHPGPAILEQCAEYFISRY